MHQKEHTECDLTLELHDEERLDCLGTRKSTLNTTYITLELHGEERLDCLGFIT